MPLNFILEDGIGAPAFMIHASSFQEIMAVDTRNVHLSDKMHLSCVRKYIVFTLHK